MNDSPSPPHFAPLYSTLLYSLLLVFQLFDHFHPSIFLPLGIAPHSLSPYLSFQNAPRFPDDFSCSPTFPRPRRAAAVCDCGKPYLLTCVSAPELLCPTPNHLLIFLVRRSCLFSIPSSSSPSLAPSPSKCTSSALQILLGLFPRDPTDCATPKERPTRANEKFFDSLEKWEFGLPEVRGSSKSLLDLFPLIAFHDHFSFIAID